MNNCSKCLDGNLTQNNLCDSNSTQCADGYVFDPKYGCKGCYLNCKNCSIDNLVCIECFPNHQLVNGSCNVACADSQYLDINGNCIDCPPFCQTCSDDTSCLTCKVGNYLSVYENDMINCSSTCPEGYYVYVSDCYSNLYF